MIGVVVALVGASGVYLLWTAVTVGPSRPFIGTAASGRRASRVPLTTQLGLPGVRLRELLAASGVLAALGAAVGWVVFGGLPVPLVCGVVMAAAPVATARHRHARRVEQARDTWPRLIEELRLQTSRLGQSLPQALIAVGRRSPEEMRPAFAAAEREWLLTTDFNRMVEMMKRQLADATADVVGETLLVAHEVGGTDIDGRLEALVEDRIQDQQGRKDARAKQAGARFARRFVVGVPVGMALAGLTIGDGRAAFATPAGQVMVMIAIALIAVCWLWAGRIMRLPEEQRVFAP